MKQYERIIHNFSQIEGVPVKEQSAAIKVCALLDFGTDRAAVALAWDALSVAPQRNAESETLYELLTHARSLTARRIARDMEESQ